MKYEVLSALHILSAGKMLMLKHKTCSKCKTFFNCIGLLLLAVFMTNCTKNAPLIRERIVPIEVSESAININFANADELERLPHVGTTTAKRIIEHREKFRAFRKPEHLLLVSGISDKRFREMRNMIKVK